MSSEKRAGLTLLTGALLTLLTATLHPKGGNILYIQSQAQMIVISHAIGLLAIPFLGVGFWGLFKRIGKDSFLTQLSFAFTLAGLLAGMMAATINGLALPIYILHYKEATAAMATAIKPIIRYNIALNQAFDYVFFVALSLAILFWSATIVITRKLPRWIGFLGFLLALTVTAMFISGYIFVNLHGFRLFLIFMVVWIGLLGITLLRSTSERQSNL